MLYWADRFATRPGGGYYAVAQHWGHAVGKHARSQRGRSIRLGCSQASSRGTSHHRLARAAANTSTNGDGRRNYGRHCRGGVCRRWRCQDDLGAHGRGEDGRNARRWDKKMGADARKARIGEERGGGGREGRSGGGNGVRGDGRRCRAESKRGARKWRNGQKGNTPPRVRPN